MGLLEEKIIARVAATAVMKSELEEKIRGLSEQLVQNQQESEQAIRKPGLFAGLFKIKE
jgi:GAF domain-containing protein